MEIKKLGNIIANKISITMDIVDKNAKLDKILLDIFFHILMYPRDGRIKTYILISFFDLCLCLANYISSRDALCY